MSDEIQFITMAELKEQERNEWKETPVGVEILQAREEYRRKYMREYMKQYRAKQRLKKLKDEPVLNCAEKLELEEKRKEKYKEQRRIYMRDLMRKRRAEAKVTTQREEEERINQQKAKLYQLLHIEG